MADQEKATVRGPTQAWGAETGRKYDVPAGETKTFTGPQGEFKSFPSDRVETRPFDPEEGSEEGDLFGAAEVPDRSFEGEGSWKTLYENGEEVGKAQCSAEEAQAWTEGDVTISELKD